MTTSPLMPAASDLVTAVVADDEGIKNVKEE
jgi:hypothetical protein